MKAIVIGLALVLVPGTTLAQPKFPSFPKIGDIPAVTSSSCDPFNMFKGLTPQNFTQRIKQCADDDLANAIADANSPPLDNAALACLIPLQTIKSAILKGGALTAFQGFRRAKQFGLITGCTNYVTSTVTLQ